MPFATTIARKGLILVALPILVEFAFVGVLSKLLLEAQHDLDQESHARAVISHLNRLSRLTEDAAVSLVKYKATRNEDFLTQYDEITMQAPLELAALRRLLADNPSRMASLTRLDQSFTEAIGVLKYSKEAITTTGKLSKVLHYIQLLRAGEKARASIEALLKPYRQLEEEIVSSKARIRKTIQECLVAGGVLNILAALLVALMFSRSIANRLGVLIENTKRIPRGEPLAPPLKGQDEIALLDEEFRDMAEQLNRFHYEQKSLIEQALASEERAKAVIENSPLGIVVLTEDNCIQSLNPRANSMFGYSTDEVHGKNVSVLISEAITDRNRQKTDEIKLGMPVLATNKRGNRKNAPPFPAEVSVSKFSSSAEKYFLLTVQDVTDRFEMERIKQEFVAMISHDLRTPLTNLQGTLELLLDGTYGDLKPTGIKRVEVAQESVERLINLINDLLDLEKMAAGSLVLDLKPTSVTKLFQHSVDSVITFAERSSVTIDFQESDLYMLVDRDRTVQVLVNLLSNAIKFSPDGGKVNVCARQAGSFVEIRVSDTGRGIPADMQETIFERFKQVKLADGGRTKGTGLGLPICKAIVEAHNGAIGLESQEGKGSTFWFRMPLVEECQGATADGRQQRTG